MKDKKTASKKTTKRSKGPMVIASGAQKNSKKLIPWRRGLYVLPILVLSLLLLGSIKLREHLVQAEQFKLVALEVDGLRLLSGAEVLEASGLQVGDNVLAIDLEDVASRLEAMPWVKRAIVVRKPPDRLVVELVERRRLAWIRFDKVYGVDEQGVLLPGHRLVNEKHGDVDLPVISGVHCEVDSLYPGLALADTVEVLHNIIEWWQNALDADPEFCTGISEIAALEDDGIGLRLAGDGLEVRLPFDQIAIRLSALKRMMPKIYREYPEPAYIDLRYAGQMVVGSKEAKQG